MKTDEVPKSVEQTLEVPGKTQAARPAGDRVAARLRGFGPLGILAILIILAGNLAIIPLSAVFALVWAQLSRTPWREIGYVRPRFWTGSLAIGIAFGSAFKLLMKIIVMPLLGADPINQAYHYLAGNPGALPAGLFAVIVGAGFGEETVFRGYMFERLGKLFGPGAWAKTFIVLLTAGWFGLVHYPTQGLAGVQQATIVGLQQGGGVSKSCIKGRGCGVKSTCSRAEEPKLT
jgi:membrane protease YdiL (CAAX protease family)